MPTDKCKHPPYGSAVSVKQAFDPNRKLVPVWLHHELCWLCGERLAT